MLLGLEEWSSSRRLSENTHLRRYPHPSALRRTAKYASFLRTYFESYWVTLNYFLQHSGNSADPKDRQKKIQNLGNRMYKRNEIELNEALSRVNFENAVGYFLSHGVKSSEDKENIQFYTETIRKYISHIAP